jgi:hypothetical protein
MSGTTYAIKAKAADMGRYEFLGSDGALVHNRIHARYTTDKANAESVASRLAASNPEFSFRVVDFSTGRTVFIPETSS